MRGLWRNRFLRLPSYRAASTMTRMFNQLIYSLGLTALFVLFSLHMLFKNDTIVVQRSVVQVVQAENSAGRSAASAMTPSKSSIISAGLRELRVSATMSPNKSFTAFQTEVLHPHVRSLKFDTKPLPPVSFNCTQVNFNNLTIPVCVYEPEKDYWISRILLNGTYFETRMVTKLLSHLSNLSVDKRVQLVDVGSNLGAYTLAAAHSGFNVLAVEATVETASRLKRSIELGGMTDRVTLLQNAVYNDHVTYNIRVFTDNRGRNDIFLDSKAKVVGDDKNLLYTITLDDLLPLMTSDRAIMKIDVEGSEIKALNDKTAGKFLSRIDVPIIFMEWVFYSFYWYNVTRRAMVDDWLQFFYIRNYSAHDIFSEKPLGPSWQYWPQNVCFLKHY